MTEIELPAASNSPEPADAPALGGNRALPATVETVAGTGIEGFADGEGNLARFFRPWDIAGTRLHMARMSMSPEMPPTGAEPVRANPAQS